MTDKSKKKKKKNERKKKSRKDTLCNGWWPLVARHFQMPRRHLSHRQRFDIHLLLALARTRQLIRIRHFEEATVGKVERTLLTRALQDGLECSGRIVLHHLLLAIRKRDLKHTRQGRACT
jgi:hypothetical protein